jgi:hypothetical protein
MDKLEVKVLLLIGCMLLFQIIYFFFKLPSPSSLDSSFNNLNPIAKTIKLLLTIAALHHLQLQSSITRIRALGETEEQHMVFSVLLTEYNDDRWVENFRMTKSTLFRIANQL